jgi:anti-anti-sigma factor
MDATGLGVLVGAHRRAQKLGRRLVLRGVSPRLARLLLATRLHRVLTLETAIDREAAIFATA